MKNHQDFCALPWDDIEERPFSHPPVEKVVMLGQKYKLPEITEPPKLVVTPPIPPAPPPSPETQKIKK